MDDISDFDGQRFHNPAWMTPASARQPGGPPQGQQGRLPLLSLLRWRMGDTRVAWPERIVDPAPAGDPNLPPGPGEVSVTFIGHSSFLIRVGGMTLLTDPMFSERASPVAWAGPKRVRSPGRPLSELPRIDLVLLSHNHYDHLDRPSLRALGPHSAPVVITPLGNARHVPNLEARELDWWQQTGFGALRITAVPARHFSSRTPRDSGQSLWAGFMVEAGGVRLLFAGDSGDGTHWQRIRERLGAPDLAFLPIGAYAPRSLMSRVHMDPEEAVRAHRTLEAAQSVGMHFGTFQLTDEAVDAPEQELAAQKRLQGVREDRFVTLGFGECRWFGTGTTRTPES